MKSEGLEVQGRVKIEGVSVQNLKLQFFFDKCFFLDFLADSIFALMESLSTKLRPKSKKLREFSQLVGRIDSDQIEAYVQILLKTQQMSSETLKEVKMCLSRY